MTKLADDLLESVKTTITIPQSQVLLTNTRILSFANDEIESKVVPMVSGLNQNYFVYQENETLTANQEFSDIPYRAIGRTLRDLKLTDEGGAVRDLTLIAMEDSHLYSSTAGIVGFYFIGDRIRLVNPTTSTGLSLNKFYLLKPNKLVESSSAGKITNVSGTTLTLSSMPSSFAANATADIIQGKQGNRLYNMDVTITNVSGLQVTLSSVNSSVSAGDYVALSCESPVIQLPDEIYPYLVFLTSKRCLEAIGDFEAAGALDKEILIRKKNCEQLLAPRIEGESIKIFNRNGIIRRHRGRYLRGTIY